jgi:hypothetical protein
MPTVAERQLAAWEKIAAGWPAEDAQQTIRICTACRKGIYLVTDQTGAPYVYTEEEILAHLVLHLRNHHLELAPGI